MSLRINGEAADFTADTTRGEFSFHDRIGDDWGAVALPAKCTAA